MGDWTPKPGDAVVAFTPAHHGPGGHIVPATVTKVGKRDVVLDTGARFPARGLVKSAGIWDPSTFLLRPDDPRVIAARLANRRSNRAAEISRKHEAFQRAPSYDTAEALIDATRPYLAIPLTGEGET